VHGYVDALNCIDGNGEATLHTRQGIKKNKAMCRTLFATGHDQQGTLAQNAV
jgi:hypothetical protein